MASPWYQISISVRHPAPRTNHGFPHWALLVRRVGGPICTHYHTEGSLLETRKRDRYKTCANTRWWLNSSYVFASRQTICTVSEVQLGVLMEGVNKTAPQESQTYVLCLLYQLEKANVVSEGTTRYYERRVCF